MILKECREWADAFGDCFRGASVGKLKRALSRLDGGGRWEAGLRGERHFKRVAFRYFGLPEDFHSFQKRADAVFPGSARLSGRPAAGLPSLSFDWDQDELSAVRRFGGAEGLDAGGGRVLYRADPWTPKILADPALKAVFADIAALCPIRELVSQWSVAGAKKTPRESWSLRFARGVPWPQFARLTIAGAFADDATLAAYLLLDRRVSEIEFEGASLSVYCGA